MNTWILKLDEVRRHVKHPRDYTAADWFMWSTVGMMAAAAVVGTVVS